MGVSQNTGIKFPIHVWKGHKIDHLFNKHLLFVEHALETCKIWSNCLDFSMLRVRNR
jgi:hypothetical protein